MAQPNRNLIDQDALLALIEKLQTTDTGQLMTLVTKAQSTADNARGMVLARDPKLDSLQQSADSAAITIAQANTEHTNLQNQINALATRLAVLESEKSLAGIGQAALTGTIGAGQTANVVVTLSRNMGSAVYYPGYSLSGGTGLLGGNLIITGVVSQTATSVTVQVKNNTILGLAVGGGVVTVVAVRDG